MRRQRREQQLCLAAPFEQVQPERGLVDRLADGEDAVVLEQQRLLVAQRARQRPALLGVVHDAREVVEDRVVAVERARVLTERLEQPTGGRPRAAAPGVGVRDRDDVGTRPVDLGVDRERRRVHRAVTGEQVAVEVDEQQVGRAEVAPAPAERVHPELVRELRVADGDVAGDPVVVPELREQPVRDRQVALAVGALLLDRRERRWRDRGPVARTPE